MHPLCPYDEFVIMVTIDYKAGLYFVNTYGHVFVIWMAGRD